MGETVVVRRFKRTLDVHIAAFAASRTAAGGIMYVIYTTVYPDLVLAYFQSPNDLLVYVAQCKLLNFTPLTERALERCRMS